MAKPKNDGSFIDTGKDETIVSFGDPSKPDMPPEEFAAEQARLEAQRIQVRDALDKLYEQDGMEIRKRILHASIYIEETVEDLLRYLFGPKIKDLGSTFAKQVDILRTMETLTDEERTYLSTFGAIRNKFIHRKKINSYTACFNVLTDQRKDVLKLVKEEMDKKPYNIHGTMEQALDSKLADPF